jgi:hypothetical protein
MSLNEFQSLTYDEIYDQIIIGLKNKLPQGIMQHKPEFEHTHPNRLRIYINKNLFPGSHYEICFRQTYYEFALHFESTPTKDLERRQFFDPYLDDISRQVGQFVKSGPRENKGRMRVWYEHKRVIIGEKEIRQYIEEYTRFVLATYPIMEKAYQIF